MMHDAVRADVLQSLTAGSGPLYDAAVADQADHSDNFRSILAAVTDHHLSTEVDGAVESVTPLVEEYLTSADEIVSTAGADPEQAQAAYPQFLEVFSALEDQLPAVGEAVGAEAAAAAQASAARPSRRRSPSPPPVSWSSACSAGSSPARSSGRSRRSAPCWPHWPTATCAAPPASRAATRSGGWPRPSRSRWPTCGRS